MAQVYIEIRTVKGNYASERSEMVATTTEFGERAAVLALAAALYDEARAGLLRNLAHKGLDQADAGNH